MTFLLWPFEALGYRGVAAVMFLTVLCVLWWDGRRVTRERERLARRLKWQRDGLAVGTGTVKR